MGPTEKQVLETYALIDKLIKTTQASTDLVVAACQEVALTTRHVAVSNAAMAYYDETEKMLGATGKRADRGAWTELVKAIRALREAEKEQTK